MTALSPAQGPFWKKFAPLFAAGAAGLVALVPTVSTLAEQQIARLPNPPSISLPVITALSMIQPTLLLIGATAVGALLAPRLGLRSHLVAKTVADVPLLPALRADLPLAVLGGAISFAAVAALDFVFRPFVAEAVKTMGQSVSHLTVSGVLGALLYGGITEELLLRWGLMTLLVWLGWRLVQRAQGLPRPAIVWCAIGLSALIFGAGHLPATAMLVPLTPPIVARAILLNGIAGMIFGWLYWRRSLEAAMIAHATFHVCVTVVALAGLLR